MTSGVWVDGVLHGGVPGDDPGLLLGLTVFETLRTYGRVPFRLHAHLERLAYSAAAMELALPPMAEIESEILAACHDDVSIRFTCTAGGHRILQVRPVDQRKVAAEVTVAPMTWDVPISLPGAVKHGARASWILEARRLGVNEVFLVDRDGYILEANRSNVFGVLDGKVVTPPLDGRQLAGITREALIEAAHRAGIPCEECQLHLDDGYSELYVASTLKELAPVVGLGNRSAPGGGPIGNTLLTAFRQLVDEETKIR